MIKISLYRSEKFKDVFQQWRPYDITVDHYRTTTGLRVGQNTTSYENKPIYIFDTIKRIAPKNYTSILL